MRVVGFRVGRLKKKYLWVILLFCLFIFFFNRSVHNYREKLLFVQLYSDKISSHILLETPGALKEIDRQVDKAKVSTETYKIKGIYRLVMTRRYSEQTFLFDDPGFLLDKSTGRCLVLPDGGQCLQAAVKRVAGQGLYGQFLTWSEVNRIFLKFDKARIRDLETGMSFMVQRRAGSNHADVQPLSAEDSAVMKTIYGGKWSWKRRAIIVELKGYRIAASMNGMPHGAGAIQGNDFNGHFCLHFRDSKLHTNKVNLAHQLMIWKAANVVEEMMGSASPRRVTEVMLEAMAQEDAGLTLKFIKIPGPESPGEIKRQLDELKWIVVSEIKQAQAENESSPIINVVVSYGLNDGTQVKNRRIPFRLVRDKGDIPWKIDARVIEELFKKDEKDEGSAEPDDSVYREWKVDMEM